MSWIRKVWPEPSPFILVILSSLILISLSLRHPIAVEFDQATQLYGVQQWHEGLVPSPLFSLLPDTRDLSRSVLYWEIWWAPGFPLLTACFWSWGVSLGGACKLVASLFYLSGNLGWLAWISLFSLSRPLLRFLAVIIPWHYFASHELISVSGEILSYGTVPWLLVGTCLLYRNWLCPTEEPAWRSFLWDWSYGTSWALVYLLKHDAFLMAPGLLAFLAFTAAMSRQRLLWLRCSSVLLWTALPLILLNWLNRHLNGHANLIAATWDPHLNWREAFHVLANIPQDLGGGYALATSLWLSATHGNISAYGWINLYGLIGCCLLLPLARSFRSRTLVEKVGWLAFLGYTLAYFLTVCLSYDVDLTPRHLVGACLAFLPLLLCALIRAWDQRVFWLRLNIVLFCLLYFAAPLTYGLTSFASYYLILERYQATGNNLYLCNIPHNDLSSFTQSLAKLSQSSAPLLWMTPDPLLNLELPERKLNAAVPLRSRGGRTSKAISISMILEKENTPTEYPKNFLSQFPQATVWNKTDLPQTDKELWTTTLDPRK